MAAEIMLLNLSSFTNQGIVRGPNARSLLFNLLIVTLIPTCSPAPISDLKRKSSIHQSKGRLQDQRLVQLARFHGWAKRRRGAFFRPSVLNGSKRSSVASRRVSSLREKGIITCANLCENERASIETLH